jgi:hypothetical protein
MWDINPLVGNDRETNNETKTIVRQQLNKYATVLETLLGSGPCVTIQVLLEAVFSMDPLRGYINSPTELSYFLQCSEVERVGWLVSELVRGLIR